MVAAVVSLSVTASWPCPFPGGVRAVTVTVLGAKLEGDGLVVQLPVPVAVRSRPGCSPTSPWVTRRCPRRCP